MRTRSYRTAALNKALRAGIDGIALLLTQGTFLVPTLATVEALVARGAQNGLPETDLAKACATQDSYIRSYWKSSLAGVSTLGAGEISVPGRHRSSAYPSSRTCPKERMPC